MEVELAFKRRFPDWQLHRGYWRRGVRENTLAAFEEAHRVGCEMVEMDVRLSKNGTTSGFHEPVTEI